MRPSITLALVLAVALVSGGCLTGRRGHGDGGDDDDDYVRDPVGDDDDDDNVIDGPTDPCEGYDPIPTHILANLSGQYSTPDGMDTFEVTGVADLTLSMGDYEYEVDGTLDIRDSGARLVKSCEDGTGSATCYGGISVTFCGSDGYFSYDVDGGYGSWSIYDSETSAYGSGEVLTID